MDGKELVLFIARASSGRNSETTDRLTASLEYTRTQYELTYGPVEERLPFLTFVNGSNSPLPTPTRNTINDLLVRARDASDDTRVVLVPNGWDGLSTNPADMQTLFEPFRSTVPIIMRVYAGNPRRFFEVSLVDALMVLNGEFEEEIDELDMPHSTMLFASKVLAINLLKTRIQMDFEELRSETYQRNTIPGSTRGQVWVCPEEGCGREFNTSERLVGHKHKHHVLLSRVACQYCGDTFSRVDHKNRHERDVCKKRPGYVPESPKRRANRGSRKSQAERRQEAAAQSDNGYPTYFNITQNSTEFPPVDPSIREDDRLVYKGELWCRYPGCYYNHRFSETTNLRTHYREIHQFQYPKYPPGHLSAREKRVHEEGLEWLARCAHYGRERRQLAGPQPLPPKRKLPKKRTVSDVKQEDKDDEEKFIP